ncbi:phosphonate metabolism protein/1,5-bisphosphokinase (PRPP-forming) PhnN [uncultured Desulfovibrio sp.]|uniref:phosphonate metabolism protein/1,5-bisphosphokinase (PRPP-forming) PhnN n=1 Tax=uncultured Desulfovibrio sp. TaxID=167968 RepID=UPI002804D6F9|nr:phosphonate metabolism protein/1,5-bisphosphokinase (PRPP-forming) PhnN [uncultured Desulfovibrio sp.]
MRGTLIYVMGPSGSGKDSLLSALRPRLRGLPVAFARRYISRPACAGGEQHMALSAGSILAMEAQGRLAMRWSSHGCQYGIGRSIDGSLERGICVIVNGSREYLPEALRRYPDLLPVLVEVEPAILRQRLLARGREQGRDLEERLQRALAPLPATGLERLVRIDNSGKLAAAVDTLEDVVRAVLPVRRMPGTARGTQGSAA